MTLQPNYYKATEWDILDAISERVLEDAEAVENLTRSLREHWFLRIPNARPETPQWYAVTVVTNFVDGGGQPFDTATTIRSILRNACLEDLERLRELRNPNERSLEELYARQHKRLRRRSKGRRLRRVSALGEEPR